MNLSVSRYSFWTRRPGGTLRYSEHSPAREQCEHAVCGYTQNVIERPEGDPDQVQQSVSWQTTMGERTVELRVSEGAIYFTLRWAAPPDNPEERKKDHGYFWVTDKHLQVEVTGTGGSNVDCTFGRVFYGNQVDISRLFNGHSPSRIVDLDQIDPNDIWLHYCSWGQEAMVTLPEGPETNEWRLFYDRAWKIHNAVMQHLKTDLSVEEIHRRVEAEKGLASLIDLNSIWLATVLDGFKRTALYQAATTVYDNTHRAQNA